MKPRNILKFLPVLLFAMNVLSVAGAVSGGAGSQQLSLDAGGAFPTAANDFSNFAGAGPMVGARYLYSLDDYFAVGIQADYFSFAKKDNTLSSPEGGVLNANFEDRAATAELVGRYTLIPGARYVPYLHSGLGFAYFHQKVNATPDANSAWADTGTTENRMIQDEGSGGVAFSFGAGVETNITKQMVLGLEAAWHILGVSKSTYGTGAINFPSVLVRLGWHFGGSSDRVQFTPPPPVTN